MLPFSERMILSRKGLRSCAVTSRPSYTATGDFILQAFALSLCWKPQITRFGFFFGGRRPLRQLPSPSPLLFARARNRLGSAVCTISRNRYPACNEAMAMQ